MISHSLSSNILRDYSENNLPRPELIYGWEFPPEKRKPSPWPLLDAMDKLGIDSGDVLMVDDLKPGKMMADSCGVDFAAAGWGHSIPIIREYMKNSCTNYLTTVSDLYKLVFKGIS